MPPPPSPSPQAGVAELFGARLREARADAGLTQERLAERAGVHYTTVSLLERGKRQPSLETLLRLSRALGVEPCVLVASVDRAWSPPDAL